MSDQLLYLIISGLAGIIIGFLIRSRLEHHTYQAGYRAGLHRASLRRTTFPSQIPNPQISNP